MRVEDVFYNEVKEVFQRFGLSFGIYTRYVMHYI